jgi:hypothetical protein
LAEVSIKVHRVVLIPRAFGQPTDPISVVPTVVLAGTCAAGEPVEEGAQWYWADREAIRDAIGYEETLAGTRLPRTERPRQRIRGGVRFRDDLKPRNANIVAGVVGN